MHETRPAKITSPIISLSDGYVRAIPVALIVGAVGVGASLLLSGADFKRFSFVYLANFCFLLSMVVGCLFFVTIMHLTRAGWSVTLRRIAELFERHLEVDAVQVPLVRVDPLAADRALQVRHRPAGWCSPPTTRTPARACIR